MANSTYGTEVTKGAVTYVFVIVYSETCLIRALFSKSQDICL